MKHFLATILLCAAAALGQTDNYISSGSVSPYLTLGRGLAWGGTGLGTVGQSFIFNPLDPNQGFCVFVFNNNPGNSHTFTLTVAQSGDPSIKTYFGNTARWTNVPTTTAFPVTVNSQQLIGINYKTTASAGVVISFSGNTTAAGSPDTADVFTVQTSQSSCGTIPTNAVQGPFQNGATVTLSQQFPVLIGGLLNPGGTTTTLGFAAGPNAGGFALDSVNTSFVGNNLFSGPSSNVASPVGLKIGGVNKQLLVGVTSEAGFGSGFLKSGAVRTNVLEMATDVGDFTTSNMPAFAALGKVTNPAAGATILHSFDQVAATRHLAYKWLIVSCSAACELQTNRTSAQGTACTGITVRNTMIGNNGTNLTPQATDVAENACTGAPTATYAIHDLQLGAGGVTQLDIGGIFNGEGNSTGAGLDVICVGAVTGIVTATLQWVEQQ